MSWSRGKTQESSEQDLEAQNDQHLNDLHTKIAALRGGICQASERQPEPHRADYLARSSSPGPRVAQQVTNDIYQDSRGQNTLLDGTSNAFDSFKVSLSNTSTRFARSVQSGKGGARIQLGIVGAFVLLFVLYKLFSGRGGTV
ncbi:SPOSA6832_00941, partial [Sporobolomyces salmonicolor]